MERNQGKKEIKISINMLTEESTYILEWNITGKTTIVYGCIKVDINLSYLFQDISYSITSSVNSQPFLEKHYHTFPSAMKRIKHLKKRMDKYMTDIAETGPKSPEEILTSLGFHSIIRN